MRPKPIYIVDLISEVVYNTQVAVLSDISQYGAQEINFVPGTPEEINEVLTLMSKQPSKESKRYPLFALIMSFPEDKGQQVGIDGTGDLNIIIARRSNNTDKTPERYTKNFKTVLYPVYLEFLNQLYLSPKFDTGPAELIPHTKIDWPYYDGSKQENAFGDYVDAIQIKIKLKILLKNCY